MKRLGIIALTFVLTTCLMAGCRRNDMQDNTGSSSEATHNSTGTTRPSSMPMPDTSGRDNTTITNPMDGITGTEDAMPRSPIPGMGR
jgi:hypothetical protein